MVSFAHIADVHLGHEQYGLDQRKEDVRASFESAVDQIVEEDVDLVLLAGDLFHSKDVDAETLHTAETQLKKLNEHGIEVLAVEGNHDAALYRRGMTWMEYLHRNGLLTLLAADFDDEPVFSPPSLDEKKVPGYVDRNGLRVFGVQYLGQRFTERILRIIKGIRKVNDGDKPKATVLLSHFGVSGQIPGVSGVPEKEAEKLEDPADYVALGHFHKRYEIGSIRNPGSLEAHSRRQAKWELGYYFVNVTPDGGLLSRYQESSRRPYHFLSFDVGGLSSPEEVENSFRSALDEEDVLFSSSPVVVLRLNGKLEFSREDLSLNRFEDIAAEMFDALHVIIDDATESKATPSILEGLEPEEADAVREGKRLDRDRLEATVFERIASEDSRYADESEKVAGAMASAKRMLLTGEDSASVAEELKAKRRELFPIEEEGDK